MEIYNGSMRTVRYFPENLSPGDSSALRELERAENEAEYVRQLQDLKRDLAHNEGLEEGHRLLVQQRLYGTNLNYNMGYGLVAPVGYYGFLPGWAGGYYGAPVLGPYGAFGGGIGGGIAGGLPGTTMAVSETLASGVGYQGPIKDSLAITMAQQATPEYAALVSRNLNLAVARVGSSPVLAKALGLPERSKTPLAYGEATAPVVLTLKNGDRVMGNKLVEGKDWLTVTTPDGGRVRVRASEVIRIDEGKGVRPAAD